MENGEGSLALANEKTATFPPLFVIGGDRIAM
jgi:hypothetical protein